MTREQTEQLHGLIAQLSVSELQALQEELDQRLKQNGSEPFPAPTPEQIQQRNETFRRIAEMPDETPADGFSGRDHDDVLYGPQSKKLKRG